MTVTIGEELPSGRCIWKEGPREPPSTVTWNRDTARCRNSIPSFPLTLIHTVIPPQYWVALGQELRIAPANIKSPLRLTDSSERAPAEICAANFLFLCEERSHVTNGRYQKAGQAAWYELCNELLQRSMAGCTAIERHCAQLRRAITSGRDALHTSSWKCRPVPVMRR